MVKYKPENRSQLEMKIIDYSAQLVEGSLEYAIDYLLEQRINLSKFDVAYNNDKTGAPAYSPKTMLKVVLFAYANGILSSRKIEKACQENVVFMALSGGHAPHFTYIAEFIHRFDEEIKNVFREVLLVCWELDLIGGEFLAIDGCKLSASAAKEWSGTFSDLGKKEEKIRKTLKHIMDEHMRNDQTGSDPGIKKRMEKIEAKADRVRKFLYDHEPRLGPRGNEIQSNITDNESARLKSSHGWIQGYNGMTMVDSKSQVVINAEVFGGNNESMYFQEFMEHTSKSVIAELPDNILKTSAVIADTGFYSEDNLKYLGDEEIDSYIPDQYYRKRDPRFATKPRFNTGRRKGYLSEVDFSFDTEQNEYTCPNGCKLKYKGERKLRNNRGKRYEASAHDCKECPLRSRCLNTEKNRNRVIYVALPRYDKDYIKEMMSKIDSANGRKIYSMRMGIVEPVYGNICHAKGMNRFNYRTKKKVNSQWLLYCMVHNIGKIANAMRN
jgi:transposase